MHKAATSEPLRAGQHELRVDFHYDGDKAGQTVVEATIPYYFAFDETFDIGMDRTSPVTDDYPATDNGFTGRLHWVHVDLADDVASDAAAETERERFRAAHD